MPNARLAGLITDCFKAVTFVDRTQRVSRLQFPNHIDTNHTSKPEHTRCPMQNHNAYFVSLQAAEAAALRGDREFTLVHLKTAMQAANKITDKAYRRLVFRALNFARLMPTAA